MQSPNILLILLQTTRNSNFDRQTVEKYRIYVFETTVISSVCVLALSSERTVVSASYISLIQVPNLVYCFLETINRRAWGGKKKKIVIEIPTKTVDTSLAARKKRKKGERGHCVCTVRVCVCAFWKSGEECRKKKRKERDRERMDDIVITGAEAT